jgi:hypothetical protein
MVGCVHKGLEACQIRHHDPGAKLANNSLNSPMHTENMMGSSVRYDLCFITTYSRINGLVSAYFALFLLRCSTFFSFNPAPHKFLAPCGGSADARPHRFRPRHYSQTLAAVALPAGRLMCHRTPNLD